MNNLRSISATYSNTRKVRLDARKIKPKVVTVIAKEIQLRQIAEIKYNYRHVLECNVLHQNYQHDIPLATTMHIGKLSDSVGLTSDT